MGNKRKIKKVLENGRLDGKYGRMRNKTFIY